MKMVAEYLERELHFKRLAHEAADPNFKATLLALAKAYRKLANERAKKLGLPMPPGSTSTN